MRLYLGRFGLLFAVAAGSGVITLIVSLAGTRVTLPALFAGSMPGLVSLGQALAVPTWWGEILALVAAALASTTIMAAADAAARDGAGGPPAGAGPALRLGLRRLWPFLVTGLVTGLTAGLGFLLLIAPGVFLGTRWSLAPVAAVLEKRRASGALGRSFALVRGLFWHVFGAVVLAYLAAGLVGIVLHLPALIPAAGRLGGVLKVLWTTAATAATLPYPYCVLVLLFREVRARKEGTDLAYDGAA